MSITTFNKVGNINQKGTAPYHNETGKSDTGTRISKPIKENEQLVEFIEDIYNEQNTDNNNSGEASSNVLSPMDGSLAWLVLFGVVLINVFASLLTAW